MITGLGLVTRWTPRQITDWKALVAPGKSGIGRIHATVDPTGYDAQIAGEVSKTLIRPVHREKEIKKMNTFDIPLCRLAPIADRWMIRTQSGARKGPRESVCTSDRVSADRDQIEHHRADVLEGKRGLAESSRSFR